MLTKALGCSVFVEPDVTVKGFIKDDIILICSDGLTNMVSDSEIYRIVKQYSRTVANELVKKANSAGGYDNITVIVIK